MQEKIEDIKHIQNTIWSMYKAYLSDHDMDEYNQKMRDLTQEYYSKGDEQLLTFCKHLLIAWMPIMTGFVEEFIGERKVESDEEKI